MKNLVKVQEGKTVTTSRLVAEAFSKQHSHVIRAIQNIECTPCFRESNFGYMLVDRELPNGGGKQDPEYIITRDGFTFLAMGFTGKRAAVFKEEYIRQFNEMEAAMTAGFKGIVDIPGVIKATLEKVLKDISEMDTEIEYHKREAIKIDLARTKLKGIRNHLQLCQEAHVNNKTMIKRIDINSNIKAIPNLCTVFNENQESNKVLIHQIESDKQQDSQIDRYRDSKNADVFRSIRSLYVGDSILADEKEAVNISRFIYRRYGNRKTAMKAFSISRAKAPKGFCKISRIK